MLLFPCATKLCHGGWQNTIKGAKCQLQPRAETSKPPESWVGIYIIGRKLPSVCLGDILVPNSGSSHLAFSEMCHGRRVCNRAFWEWGYDSLLCFQQSALFANILLEPGSAKEERAQIEGGCLWVVSNLCLQHWKAFFYGKSDYLGFKPSATKKLQKN